MEGRMTVCNMSIEGGARAGLIAPDEATFEYLKGRPMSPKAGQWEAALTYWRSLPSDEGAVYDTEVTLATSEIEPQVTWGTSPEDVLLSRALRGAEPGEGPGDPAPCRTPQGPRSSSARGRACARWPKGRRRERPRQERALRPGTWALPTGRHAWS